MGKVWYLVKQGTACIHATGEDAPGFLQSQFSNNILPGGERACTYGLWLDRKGRVVADSWVLQRPGDERLLYSFHSSAASIISKLEAFIIADDVTLEDFSASMQTLALWGENAGTLLQEWGFLTPEPGTYTEQDGIYIVRARHGHGPSFNIIFPQEAESRILQHIASTAPDRLTQATTVDLERERVRAGIPAIPQDAEDALPQELGIEGDAVSFNKGCYIGQEVMARVRQTGRYTRQLVRVDIAGEPPAMPAALSSGGEDVGELRSAFPDTDGHWIGLAFLRRKFVDSGETRLSLPNGIEATMAASCSDG